MFFDLIEAISTIIALLFTGIQVLLLVLEMRQGNRWNSQDASFNYCSAYSALLDSLDMDSIDIFLLELEKSTPDAPLDPTRVEFQSAIQNITILLQYFERLSVGLVCGYFDEEIVRRIMNYTFIQTYKKYKPYILFRQKYTGTMLMSHFIRVAESWENTPVSYPFRTVPSAKKQLFKKVIDRFLGGIFRNRR